MKTATNIMNDAIEQAIEDGKRKERELCEERGWDYRGGIGPGAARVETAHGEVTCMITMSQSRIAPGKPFTVQKRWRLNDKIISAAKLQALLDS